MRELEKQEQKYMGELDKTALQAMAKQQSSQS